MAIVLVNEKTLDFIFDENVNNYNMSETVFKLDLLTTGTKVVFYYIDENDTYVEHELPVPGFGLNFQSGLTTVNDKKVYMNGFFGGLILPLCVKYSADVLSDNHALKANVWYLYNALTPENLPIKIKGFRFENLETAWHDSSVLALNKKLVNYIGGEVRINIYSIAVNGTPLKLVNGTPVKRLKNGFFIYELVERPSDELPDDTTLVFTADTTDICSLSWYNEDTTQEIQVYLNDEFIGASSESNATIDFPYNLVSGDTYRITFKGGKLNIGGESWFVSTTSKTNQQSGITEVAWGKNYGSRIYYLAFLSSSIATTKLPPSIRELVGKDGLNGVFGNSLLSSIILNEGLEIIGRSAFSGCSNLTTLTIPSSVNSVETTALYAAAGNTITFKHTENDELTLASQIFNKPKSAVAMTIKHYGNSSVLNYNWSGNNITPTFVDLREQQ